MIMVLILLLSPGIGCKMELSTKDGKIIFKVKRFGVKLTEKQYGKLQERLSGLPVKENQILAENEAEAVQI